MLLSTERMTLRPITAEDRDLLVDLDADAEVMQYLGPPSTADDIDRVIAAELGARWLGFLTEPVGANAANEFVGWYGISPGPGPDDRQLGYRLRRPLWGAGLATEGCRALIEHGFTDLGTTRIWAQTMAVNERSRAVMTRCGLTYVRTFHLEWDDPLPGADLGEVEYALWVADWARTGADGRD
ncbi:MAG: GNAT family N-acetyltransferase [Actinomycetota bacterium]